MEAALGVGVGGADGFWLEGDVVVFGAGGGTGLGAAAEMGALGAALGDAVFDAGDDELVVAGVGSPAAAVALFVFAWSEVAAGLLATGEGCSGLVGCVADVDPVLEGVGAALALTAATEAPLAGEP